jgi:hypothetical protein
MNVFRQGMAALVLTPVGSHAAIGAELKRLQPLRAHLQ